MKTKRKWLALAMAVLYMAYMAGCGKASEAGVSNTAATLQGTLGGAEESKPTETVPQESGNLDKKNTEDQKTSMEELPEGYVYDYQVSLEPIPKEIADLGGDCVGTMHAFPSRIMVGLMKQRMEEDPEFKKEAEQKIQEAKKSLLEETGKDFGVEVMWVSDDNFDWYFYCTEQDTDYHFCLRSYNFTSGAKYYTYYYTRMRTKAYGKELKEIISQIYGDAPINLWCHENMNIYVAQFPEGEIDYIEEQAKLLALFQALEQLPRYDEELDWHILGYDIFIGYYPPEYKELITVKYQEGLDMDVLLYEQNQKLGRLMDNGEIKDAFWGMYDWHESSFPNGYNLLEDYKNGTYDKTQKWDDWVTGGKGND